MTAVSPDPLERSAKLDRLFDRVKFRRRTLAVYRVAGPLVLAVCLYYALAAVGLLPAAPGSSSPGWLGTAFLLLGMGIAAITPLLFFISTVGGLATAADWRFAAPLWCFSASSGLFLVTAFMGRGLTHEDRVQIWLVASIMFCLSAAWATVVGYSRKRDPAG